MSNSSIWPIDRTQSGQNGPESDGNERILRIPQSSRITGGSPSDCLLSYPEHSLEGFLPHCRLAVGVFCSPRPLGNLTVIGGLPCCKRCSRCILQPQAGWFGWCTVNKIKGARGVMVIAVGNVHGDTSSNPGRDWLHFT